MLSWHKTKYFTFESLAFISTNLVSLLSMQRKPTLKAYKYRIYPTDAQVLFFAKTFGCCRFVWNKMPNEKLQAYKKKELIPRPTPVQCKELIKLHKIESRMKTNDAVSDNGLFTI